MAVSKERKQVIYQAALQKELDAATGKLVTVLGSAGTATTGDPLADATAEILRIRDARDYVADVKELLTAVQNPEAPVVVSPVVAPVL